MRATYLSNVERGWSRPTAALLRVLAVAAAYADGSGAPIECTRNHRVHASEAHSMGDGAIYAEAIALVDEATGRDRSGRELPPPESWVEDVA